MVADVWIFAKYPVIHLEYAMTDESLSPEGEIEHGAAEHEVWSEMGAGGDIFDDGGCFYAGEEGLYGWDQIRMVIVSMLLCVFGICLAGR